MVFLGVVVLFFVLGIYDMLKNRYGKCCCFFF